MMLTAFGKFYKETYLSLWKKNYDSYLFNRKQQPIFLVLITAANFLVFDSYYLIKI